MRARGLVAGVAAVAAIGVSFAVGRATAPSTPTTTTTSAPGPAVDAVWPTAQSGIHYGGPLVAARGFATDVLAMADPVVGAYRAGDPTSGEVPVRASAQGPETTVLVRRGAGQWWSVIAAVSPNISITSPAAGSRVASPLSLRGTSTAFEGVVDFAVRDDAGVTLARGTAMGGSNGVRGAYSVTVHLSAPTRPAGLLMVWVKSARDGTCAYASVIRLHF